MGSVGLLVVTLVALSLAAAMGLIATFIAAKTHLARGVAFGWGAVLGPVGVAVVGVIAFRSSVLPEAPAAEGFP